MQVETRAKIYLLGNFDTEYYFNFFSQVIPKYFVSYTEQQLHLRKSKYLYINYNRKPRDHRSALVNQLIDEEKLKIKKELINAAGINIPLVPNKEFLNIADVYCKMDM
jgi:hypothetical protein